METTNQQMTIPEVQAALHLALSRAQGEFLPLVKNREVVITSQKGSYKFRYADLEACIAATRPALAKHELAVTQPVVTKEDTGEEFIETSLHHSGGGSIFSRARLPAIQGDFKSFGAAITYLRRYCYCAMLGIAADDDLDENGVLGAQPKKESGSAPKISFEKLSKQEQIEATRLAGELREMFSDSIPKKESLESADLFIQGIKKDHQDNEDFYPGMWGLIPSTIRTALRKYGEELKAQGIKQ